jgi:hypothetical protein
VQLDLFGDDSAGATVAGLRESRNFLAGFGKQSLHVRAASGIITIQGDTMTRTALTAKLTRNAPGSYTIMVDGVNRGSIDKLTDCDGRTYWCGQSNGSAWCGDTKREVVDGLPAEWDRTENELIRAHNKAMNIQ